MQRDKLVMLVDDELGLLALFGGLVKRLNCEVIEVDGGAAAIDLLNTHTPDVLVLDLAMPNVNGGDVLDFISHTPHLSAMRIVVLTALGLGAIRNDLPDIVDKWVNKPVHPDAFLKLMRDVLDGDNNA